MNRNNSLSNNQTMKKVNIIGAGLAGSEAAWQLVQRGIPVRLYEMRPKKYSPAHHTDKFGELVCSNSLRANNIENAVGLLKEELRRMKSLIMHCADENQVPAGGALAVDREKFSAQITDTLTSHPLIEIIYDEVTQIPEDEITIIATGLMVERALDAAERLAAEGIKARVINMATIKPLDEEIVLAAAKETGAIVTAEEHSVIGGLGSAVAEVLAEKLPTPVVRVGVNDTFGMSGAALELLEKFGLGVDDICAKAKQAIALK